MTDKKYPTRKEGLYDQDIEEVQAFALTFSFTDAAYGVNLFARFGIQPTNSDRGILCPRDGEIRRITIQSDVGAANPSDDSGVRLVVNGVPVGTTQFWSGSAEELDASPTDWLIVAGQRYTIEYVDGETGATKCVGYAEINYRRGGQGS